MAPHVVFNNARESLGVFTDVCGVFTRADESDLRFKTKPVFSGSIVPMNKHRHDRGTGMQREPREARRRASRDAQKIDEDDLGNLGVLVGQNPHRAVIR